MMIIDLINFMANLFSGTNFSFSFDPTWIAAIQDILNFISWVIPLDTVIFVFSFSLILLGLRLLIAVYRLIPLCG